MVSGAATMDLTVVSDKRAVLTASAELLMEQGSAEMGRGPSGEASRLGAALAV